MLKPLMASPISLAPMIRHITGQDDRATSASGPS